MLRSLNDLVRTSVHAIDGEVGRIEEFFFDDEKWALRYILVKTGWLNRKRKVISPISVKKIDWSHDQLSLSLTQNQVKNSPDLDTEQPVSRQKEMEFYDYYRWPYYWTNAGVWGIAPSPSLMLTKPYLTDLSQKTSTAASTIHLRSTQSVIGYRIEALDGRIGHVEDFLFDDETWTIRYLVIDTRNWFPGKRVLLSPEWVDAISWEEEKLSIHLLSEKLKQSPDYHPNQDVDQEYEERLHQYYYTEISRPKTAGG